MVKMVKIKCETCGKEIKGKTQPDAQTNLEVHKVTHGQTNRFNMSKTNESKKRKEQIKRVKRIRELCEELLKGTTFGKSTSRLQTEIKKRYNEKYSMQQIGGALRNSMKICMAAGTSYPRGKTWILKSELN